MRPVSWSLTRPPEGRNEPLTDTAREQARAVWLSDDEVRAFAAPCREVLPGLLELLNTPLVQQGQDDTQTDVA